MTWYWVLGGGILILVVLAYYTNVFRYAKSLYLISTIEPYEQVGAGAGRILFVGDSTGYGTGAADAADSVAGRLGAEFPDYAIENRSVNGDTIAEATQRVQSLTGQYDLIILQLGGNDIIQKHPIEEIESAVADLYAVVLPHAAHVIMLSAGNVGGAAAFRDDTPLEYQELSRQYHARLEQFAATRPEFTYVNLFDEPADDPFVAEPQIYLAIDGLHPSSAGYALWYARLAPIVRSVLVTDGSAAAARDI